MLTVNAYAATSPTDPLVPSTITRRDVGPKDVLIEIAYAGICHSDIHTVRGEWGPSATRRWSATKWPAPSSRSGSDVTRHAIGDRVGVGTIVNSCRECDNCRNGQEQYCLQGNTQAYNSIDRDGTITQGGYSTHVVVDEDFVLRIPATLDFSKVAPLLCAGITTYSPLRHWQAGPGNSVAVVGMGGLGHLGVKLSHAMGAEVTVLSQTLSKRTTASVLAPRVSRNLRPLHVHPAREPFRLDHQHRLRRRRPRRLPAAAAPRRHPGQCRCPAGASPN